MRNRRDYEPTIVFESDEPAIKEMIDARSQEQPVLTVEPLFIRCVAPWLAVARATLASQLVLDALDMALQTRRPQGVIHHSDQGSQYTSIEFGQRCRDAGVRPSMGSVGDAYDNAMCESFFATLECEPLARSRFRTPAEARSAVFGFIEGFYNPRRRHSSIGHLSPVEYERQHQAIRAVAGALQPAAVLAAVKDKPCGRPQEAAVLDRRCDATAAPSCGPGRKNGSAGANQQMSRHRSAACRQITPPDPKPSTLYETGAGPLRE